MLRRQAHASVTISHASILAPFGLGCVLAYALRNELSDPSVPFPSFALFLGAAMSITAFPVLARILSEQRLLRTKVGSMAITSAAVGDALAWCILAFVVAASHATGLRSAMVTTALTLGYIALMFGAVRPLLARVGARVSRPDALTKNAVAGVLLLLFASSFVTELIGIHALFGAFLFGAILPKGGGFARTLADKLEELVLVVLLPLFFAYSGLRTQIHLLDTPHAWALCALVIAVACLGKFGGTALSARATGLTWRESSALGVLMNTRGLMELIVLNIGLDLGVISPSLFAMLVVMAVVTTLATSPILRLVYPAGEIESQLPGPTPVPPPAKRPFTVLVCVADARTGPGLVTLAAALTRAEPSRLFALRLVRPAERGSFSDAHAAEIANGSFAPLLERAAALDVAFRLLSFLSADPARDIADVARAQRADLVLLGSHKPLFGQSLLGGTVYRVMRESSSTVGVLVDRGLTQVRRILVPFTGTPHDRAALDLARRSLTGPNIEVVVLHVVAPKGRDSSPPLGARDAFTNAFEEITGGRVVLRVVESDSPTGVVLGECKDAYDLVIIGLGRDWGLEQRPFGIQRERVLMDCPTSLLVVRHAEATVAEPAPAAFSAQPAPSAPAK